MKLLEILLTLWVIAITGKVFIFWATQKLQQPQTPKIRTKVMDARADHTSKMFNELLKAKQLDYATINSINQILKRYSNGQKYKSNIHLIYSVLKHATIKNKDLAQIQFILDCTKSNIK